MNAFLSDKLIIDDLVAVAQAAMSKESLSYGEAARRALVDALVHLEEDDYVVVCMPLDQAARLLEGGLAGILRSRTETIVSKAMNRRGRRSHEFDPDGDFVEWWNLPPVKVPGHGDVAVADLTPSQHRYAADIFERMATSIIDRARFHIAAADLLEELDAPSLTKAQETHAARTREALTIRRTLGLRLGRPVQTPADIRDRIVRERANGVTFAAIAESLNIDEVATAHGGRQWHASTVRKIALSGGAA